MKAPRSSLLTFETDEGPRELRMCFDANAMLDLEQMFELKSLQELGDRFNSEKNPISMSAVINLVLAGARRYQPEITSREIGALLGPDNLADVLGATVRLLAASNVDVDAELKRIQEVRIAENPLPTPTSQDASFGLSAVTTSDSPTTSLGPILSENSPS